MNTTPRTFAQTLARTFAANMVAGLLFVCALAMVNMTTPPATSGVDNGARECWIASTAQIITVDSAESCPAN